ncbi:hypothetical protein AWB78_04018 [Caballeronia calidae]|uniref:Uncharacterized protein n=1 Tax=Caballeronia calidae TaxID=1777139 RepID=A0A158CJE0_9BURK|nr:hypothetical protein AWB78_04018 [Caballeronia calidae]
MHNQTDPVHLANMQQGDLGTGIFLIPWCDADDYEFGAVRKVFKEKITYAECVLRGQNAVAFKWIPQTVASAAELRQHDCHDAPCARSCKQHGCACNDLTGRCK